MLVLFSDQVIGNSFAYTLPALTDAKGGAEGSEKGDKEAKARVEQGVDNSLSRPTMCGACRHGRVLRSCAAFCAVKFYAFEALEEFALIAAIIALH